MLLWQHGYSSGLLLLVKQRLARLVPAWVTQGSCSGAVIGWVQVYYKENSTLQIGKIPQLLFYGRCQKISETSCTGFCFVVLCSFILLKINVTCLLFVQI